MATLYKRKLSLIVSTVGGEGLDLSELRIVFDVKLSDEQAPNAARIRVYNLSQNTISRIRREFTVVNLQAGYQENFATIFNGNIKQVVYGSENNVDTFIDISAADGDFAYNTGVINKTLAAGATQQDIADEALKVYNNIGVDTGNQDGTSDSTAKLPRSKVMYGMVRDILRKTSENTNSTWSIQNNTYQSVKLTGVLPGPAVVLNSKTGLVYTPNQTNQGIIAKSLLNPQLKIAGKIQINQSDIQKELIDEQTSTGDSVVSSPSAISADGFYRLYTIEHQGDTRGQDWYSTLTCLTLDATSDSVEVRGG